MNNTAYFYFSYISDEINMFKYPLLISGDNMTNSNI